MLRKDWMERLIEQLAETVRRAFGLAQAGDTTAALALFDDLYRSLGVGRDALDRLDPTTLRTMLGERTRTMALVLTAEADVLAAAGRQDEAKRRRTLAAQLVS